MIKKGYNFCKCGEQKRDSSKVCMTCYCKNTSSRRVSTMMNRDRKQEAKKEKYLK